MFEKKLLLVLVFFFIFFSIGLSQTLAEFERKRNLEFHISIEKEFYLIHEPLWIHCLIKNNTSESIPAYIPSITQTSVVITNMSGDTVCCRYDFSETLGRPSTERFLEPGEEWYFCKIADKEFKPGVYSLQVVYPTDPYFYMDDFQKESGTRWKNIETFFKYMHTGDLYSNKLLFNVVAPKTQTDIDAYNLLQKIFNERQNRKGGQYQEYFDSMSVFMETYAEHPYAAAVYPSYLYYLQRVNLHRYREVFNSIVSIFPNTALSHSIIHQKALDFTNEEEREQYFKKLISDYTDQWLSKYVIQLDRRFDVAEASGWINESKRNKGKGFLDKSKRE